MCWGIAFVGPPCLRKRSTPPTATSQTLPRSGFCQASQLNDLVLTKRTAGWARLVLQMWSVCEMLAV